MISFARRNLNLNAVPRFGTSISSIDLDLTVECNLRCTYCFKEKWNEHMEEDTALDSIVWLLYASGPIRDLRVNFMGGEPLLRFKLIKKLVPFAKRRASQFGKRIHFGVTTNGTLISEEVVAFWKQWGMGFHTSIDGTPDVQDMNRPTTGGRGSSHLVEKGVAKILSYRPNVTARSTVVPANAHRLVDSYLYFRSLGYVNIAFVPGSPTDWNTKSIDTYERQLNRIADMLMDEYRNGTVIRMKGVDDHIEGIVRGKRPSHSCGAGRGLLLVDIHGDIWPCHRWNKAAHASWRIGSIYEHFDDAVRKSLDCSDQTVLLEQDCPNCPANSFCSGGCPAENLDCTGHVYRRHVNSCELTRVWARVGQRVHDTLRNESCRAFIDHFYANDDTATLK